MSHETDHWEDDKTREKTGTAVDTGNDERVSTTQTTVDEISDTGALVVFSFVSSFIASKDKTTTAKIQL